MNTTTLTAGRPGLQIRPGVILATCCLSLFIVGVDVTIVSIALPSIQRSFSASIGGLQWTVDAYTLVLPAC
jgi:MFS family permease